MTETTGTRRTLLVAWIVAAIMLAGGIFIRGWDLEHNPPGLWQDEASTGVDAHLLWKTGRDRAGDFLPVISRSFGDYPLALYRYLTAPIMGLLGVTIAHQRWVSALSGISLLLSMLVFARLTLGMRVALCALLSGVLTPTWIHFSRYGSEAMLLPATLMAGLALFEVARRSQRWWIAWVAAFVLAASAYTYHAVKLFLPLWMVPFLWYQWPLVRVLWREQRRHVIGPAAVFALSVLPSMIMALTPEGMARGRTVAAWEHAQGADLYRAIAHNYLAYFEPTMLFLHGGPAVAQSIPGVGIWSLLDLPLMIVGLVVAVRRFAEHRAYGLVLAWFVLGPVPGGITFEAHNIGRVIGWLPAPQIISGIGMAAVVGWVWSAWRSGRVVPALAGLAVAVGLVAGWSATALLMGRLTLVRYPRTTERDWQFEVSRALLCAKGQRNGRAIVLSPSFPAPEIFALFHLADLPRESWSIASRTVVASDELYAMMAHDPRPTGSEVVCEVKQLSTGETKALVVAAAPVPTPAPRPTIEAEPSIEGAPRASTAPAIVPVPSTSPPTKGTLVPPAGLRPE